MYIKSYLYLLVIISITFGACDLATSDTSEVPIFPEIDIMKMDVSFFGDSVPQYANEYLSFSLAKELVTGSSIYFAHRTQDNVFELFSNINPTVVGGIWLWEIKNVEMLEDSGSTIKLYKYNDGSSEVWIAKISSNPDFEGNYGLTDYTLFELVSENLKPLITYKIYPIISSREPSNWYGKIAFKGRAEIDRNSIKTISVTQYIYPIYNEYNNPDWTDTLEHVFISNSFENNYLLKGRYINNQVFWDTNTGEGFYERIGDFKSCWDSDKLNIQC